MSTHARFAPSSADRLLVCAASQPLERLGRDLGEVQDSASIHSATGTAAHDVLERTLRGQTLPKAGTVVEVDGFQVTITAEMLDHIEGVAEAVHQKAGTGPLLEAEHKVEIGAAFGLPEGLCAGTSDIVAIDADGVLHVGDLKYGVSPVSPDSMQLKLYAVGALHWILLLYDVKFVELTIYQPRLDAQPSRLFRVDELMDDAEGYFGQVRHAMHIYDEIKGHDTLQAAIDATVEHQRADVKGCWWCPVKAMCPTHRDAIVKQIEQTVGGVEVKASPGTLAEALDWADAARRWATAVEDAGKEAAIRGVQVPGWALGERKSNRAWGDESRAEAVVAAKLGEQAYVPAKLISPAQAEKLGLSGDDLAPLLAERTSSVTFKRDKGNKGAAFVGWRALQASRLKDAGFKPV